MRAGELPGSSLAHSDLILDKIDQDRDLGRFVSIEELQRYIEDFFRRNPGSILQWQCDVPGCFRLELSPEAHDRLRDHLRAQKLEGGETWQSRKLLGTLDPAVATRPAVGRQRPIFINHLSPLVSWITCQNERHPKAFFDVSAVTLEDGALAAGTYLYAVQRWSFEGLRKKKFLSYGFTRLEDGTVMNETESEQVKLQRFRRTV